MSDPFGLGEEVKYILKAERPISCMLDASLVVVKPVGVDLPKITKA